MQRIIDKQKYVTNITLVVLTLWVVYSSFYVYSSLGEYQYISGFFPLLGEVGLDLAICFLGWKSWKYSNKMLRKFFFLITIAYAFSIFSDTMYNFILNIKRMELDPTNDVLFDTPFLFYLLFNASAWYILGKGNEDEFESRLTNVTFLPYITVSITIFTLFVFGANWKINYFSVIGVYQILDTMLEALVFSFVSFCLIRAKELWLKSMAVGTLIIISSDFIIRSSVVENSIKTVSPIEIMWMFGLVLIILSFFLKKVMEIQISHYHV